MTKRRSNAMTAPLRHSVFRPVRGSRTLPTLAALDQRNALIVDTRRMFHASASDREAARLIHLGLTRFEAGPWRRLRAETACPARYIGRIERAYFVILRAVPRPPSEIRIRQILATRYPPSLLIFDHLD